MKQVLLARLTAGAVCLAALAGWFGFKVELGTSSALVITAPAATAWEPFAPSEPALVAGQAMVAEAEDEPASPAGTQAAAVPVPQPLLPQATPAPPTPDGAAEGATEPVVVLASGALVPPVPPVVPFAGGFIPLSQTLNRAALDGALGDAEPAAHGEWREVGFYSPALDREMTYFVWLPPGYESARPGSDEDAAGAPGAAASATYPTLYLLHGLGTPERNGKTEWRDFGVGETLDRLLALDLIEPMIVVLPEGEQGYWINQANGGPRWADYVTEDVVGDVDATFRTDARRERRAVGGLSMGAHGALQLALNRPEVFAIVGSHAPTLRSYERAPQYFGDLAWFGHNDPLTLVQATTTARRFATWLDVGHLDSWRMGVERLRQVMAAQGAPMEYRVLEGEHQTWYWATYLPEYLRFYSRAFGAQETTPDGAPRVAAWAPPVALVAGGAGANGGGGRS
ncbi:MAG TPA: alpha/beta hydrolase-fold protein [Chloroflexota bacterium]|nr:alpha/beta hydrolase-fold protein [Chloroflexota bacterium]